MPFVSAPWARQAVTNLLIVVLIVSLLTLPLSAQQASGTAQAVPAPTTQAPAPVAPPVLPNVWAAGPLAQDTGFNAVYQDLVKLRTTGRLLHVTAHPDDEDGGLLTLASRGLGASVMLATLNRGEGGQNKFGSELFDELGILRTLELVAADQYYGCEQRFTRVADFGFSKNAAETFQKWGGHDVALGDLVRIIRSFRPDVITTAFTGTPRDGHGNHEASAILAQEAFRAAADPARFPEQLREGLLPWRASKLYLRARGDEATLRMNTGVYAPVLGSSYVQFALEGLAHQISQGTGGLRVPPGDRFSGYRLADSANGLLPSADKQLFDFVDTSLPGLASRLGPEQSKVPFLRRALEAIDGNAQQAIAGFTLSNPSRAAGPLLEGVANLQDTIAKVAASTIDPAPKLDLLTHLRTKLEQFQKAAADALGLALTASVDPPQNAPQQGFFRFEQTFLMAYPGQTFTLTAHFYNRSQQNVDTPQFELLAPAGWKWEMTTFAPQHGAIVPNGEASAQFSVTVPENAEYTKPYFHRNDPQQENAYTIDDPRWLTQPFAPPPLIVRVRYTTGPNDRSGEMNSAVQVKYVDPIYGQQQRPMPVGPPLSVELEPPTQVVPTQGAGATHVRVGVRNNVIGGAKATLRLEAPSGWKFTPASMPVSFSADGEYQAFDFTVTPPQLSERRYQVKAVLDYNGKQVRDGYRVVTRHDLGAYYYYHPAEQNVSAVQVKTPPRLRVGYIMGAGDDIPPVLRQVGINVSLIPPQELASGDLSVYDAIVLGIRAYDVRTDVREHNRRLLGYVSAGGRLIVQYNAQTALFNAGHYTPYPATLGSDRVTVEEAPVEVLAAQDSVFHAPNHITAHDFDGWVQERGLYFMHDWDARYTPLLASHDPGESPLKGGLLVARYGKGTWIYTGYAFFRQLPAGVPGATRLFVNLLGPGKVHGPPSAVHGNGASRGSLDGGL